MTDFDDDELPEELEDSAQGISEYLAQLDAEEKLRRDQLERRRAAIRARRGDTLEFFHLSERGDADRFASRNADRVRCDVTGRRREFFYVDDDKRWVHDVSGEVTVYAGELVDEMADRGQVLKHEWEQARDLHDRDSGTYPDPGPEPKLAEWARSRESTAALRSMPALGCELHGMMVVASREFDRRRELLAAGNAVFELYPEVRTRQLEPDDMVTYNTGVAYRSERLASPPDLVAEYLGTFMPDPERVRLVFKLLGSTLVGHNAHRLFVIFQGGTTTGKSQLMEAVDKCLGTYSATGSSSVFRGHLDEKPRADLLRLMQKRLVVFNEASKAWELHGDRVKDLTGGGDVAVRDLYSSTLVNEEPFFTPVVVTNEMPRITGVDPGLKRRMVVVEFTERPAVERPGVKREFTSSVEVQEWLLARLIQGYMESVAEGLDDVLQAFTLDTARAFEDLTHVRAFKVWLIDTEQLSRVPERDREAYGIKNTYVRLIDLYDRYTYWVKNYGNQRDKRELLSYQDFNIELRQAHGWEDVVSGKRRWLGWQLSDMPPMPGSFGSWTDGFGES